MNVRRRGIVAAIAFAVPLGLAACGSSDTTTAGAPAATASQAAPETTKAPMSDASAAVFGSGCAAVPKDGKGSFNGMATDPVATAASNNPLLKTLVTAVGAAGLGDTLNTTPDITVFAPVDSAFAKLPPAALKAALADPKGLLTKILTNHVVQGKITPDMLAGDHKTLEGGTLKVTGSGEAFKVNGENNIICGNVPTANATVYIVDGVLLPS
ncbi:MAG: fasciclin domain-containing protein [Dermatophilaceae bacterium]